MPKNFGGAGCDVGTGCDVGIRRDFGAGNGDGVGYDDDDSDGGDLMQPEAEDEAARQSSTNATEIG